MNRRKIWAYAAVCRAWVWFCARRDRKLNVDFESWEEYEKIGFGAESGNPYQPSTKKLGRILKKYPIIPQDAIVDIGCGKGKAMHMMHAFPFRAVDGIELSETLCVAARRNLKTLGLDRCRILQADAAEYDGYDEYNYFYLFNPFLDDVFRKVLLRISDSLHRRPRDARLIYLNPVCHSVLEQCGLFQLTYKSHNPVRWFRYYCYFHKA